MNAEATSDLAQRIARQREAQFLTQRQLASTIGVTQSAVARWETGETVPALRHRRKLAEALMISPAILFDLAAA